VRERAAFTVEACKEREKVTTTTWRPSWTSSRARWRGRAGWVHHGLTSSDVLDTALGLQLSQAGMILVGGAADYRARS
jgi:adenylosuccinate lyase